MRLVEQAHQHLAALVGAGDTVIDATMGNGHDSLFLAELIGPGGHCYAFDVQEQALENTRQRLLQSAVLERVSLFHLCHSKMDTQIPALLHGKIRAVVFNLGYLPGAEKAITTTWSTTLQALGKSSTLLAEGGILSILVYPGHSQGRDEFIHVELWIKEQSRNYNVHRICPPRAPDHAPQLFILKKL